ncbi:MAG: hypothetical protein RR501_12260 [Cloacibacillus sp.]
MVLPLKGLWLIAAMAIVWFGNCGGMAVMIEYRIALSICTVIFTAIYAISVIIANVLSQGWFDLWRPFSMVLPLLVFCFLSADSTAKLFFICFTQLNVCGFIVISSGLAVSAFANPGPVLIPLLLLMNGGML